MCANRVGKSFSFAYEFSRHLTGNYPDDWPGLKQEGSGRLYWVLGVDLSSVANVIQKELLGVSDCRIKENLGTGAIEKENIITDTGWMPDGAALRSCLIRHKDGGFNTLRFYGSNNEATLMGQTVNGGVWIDELPPHNDLRIYSQCLTRTATVPDAFVTVTATPEFGRTDLIKMYQENKTGLLYLQSATWDQAPHLTEEVKADILSGYPEWQWGMRTRGEPVIGTGAVYDFPDSAVMVAPILPENMPRHWHIIHGVDFGMVVDASTVSTVAYDPDNDVAYLVDSIRLDGKDGRPERSPEDIAKVILSGPYPNATVIVPHDAGLNSAAAETKGKTLMQLGVNVHRQPFRNPVHDAHLMIDQNTWKQHSGVSNSIEAGLSLIRSAVKANKLKVCSNCEWWFKEKQGYFYRAQPTGYKPHGEDHHLDSFRYAYVGGILNNLADTVAEATAEHTETFHFDLGLSL